MKYIVVYLYRFFLNCMLLKQKLLGGKAYGLGWVPSKIPFEFEFTFANATFIFIPAAARSYGYLPANKPNEPETHLFLGRLLDIQRCELFVDVGASVGEFVIAMAYHPRVTKVIAFEPHPASRLSLEKASAYAPSNKIQIVAKGVAANSGHALFNQDERSPSASSLISYSYSEDITDGTIELCSLDEFLPCDQSVAAIILIDVEGGELDVLRGAMNFISKSLPIIIFEYNQVTRKFFTLTQVKDLLGSQYTFYNLRSSDGLLDTVMDNTWNIVALPLTGYWKELSAKSELFFR